MAGLRLVLAPPRSNADIVETAPADRWTFLGENPQSFILVGPQTVWGQDNDPLRNIRSTPQCSPVHTVLFRSAAAIALRNCTGQGSRKGPPPQTARLRQCGDCLCIDGGSGYLSFDDKGPPIYFYGSCSTVDMKRKGQVILTTNRPSKNGNEVLPPNRQRVSSRLLVSFASITADVTAIEGRQAIGLREKRAGKPPPRRRKEMELPAASILEAPNSNPRRCMSPAVLNPLRRPGQTHHPCAPSVSRPNAQGSQLV